MPGGRAEKASTCQAAVGDDPCTFSPRATAQAKVDPKTGRGAAVGDVFPAWHSPQKRLVRVLKPEEDASALADAPEFQQPGTPTVIPHHLSKDTRRKVRNTSRDSRGPHGWGKSAAERSTGRGAAKAQERARAKQLKQLALQSTCGKVLAGTTQAVEGQNPRAAVAHQSARNSTDTGEQVQTTRS